jgi:hypothetical protein
VRKVRLPDPHTGVAVRRRPLIEPAGDGTAADPPIVLLDAVVRGGSATMSAASYRTFRRLSPNMV